MAPEPVHPLKLASVFLQYPTSEAVEAAGSLQRSDLEALRRHRAAVERFLGWYRERSLGELQRHYVEAFDFDRKRSLHLTYHLHGDSRQRGVALLRLRQAYAAAGFEVDDRELPDYLPLMLEFAALAPEPGLALLEQNRVAVELVRAGLDREDDPYGALLEVVCAELPGLTRRQLARLRRLATEGPPTEQVGLEPFAPPEVMPAEDGGGAAPMVGGRP